MTEAVPIYKDQDFYVPHFEVKVRDRPLDREVIHDIIQVSYKDSLEDIDSFELTINNWNAQSRTFKFSDKDIFNPGKQIELWMGYFGKGEMKLMLKGEITSLRPSFPAAGQPTLVVSGLNLLHRLRNKQETQPYEKMTDSQIARDIAQRLHIDIEVETQGSEEQYDYILQDNKYDILFLLERARRIGYDLSVVEEGENGRSQPSKLRFAPSSSVKRATYELKYGLSLIEFQPNLTTANQVNRVIVQGWDAIRKQPIKGEATRDELTTRGVGNAQDQQALDQAFDQRQEIIADRPIHSEQEAKKLAKETLERIAKDMITGSGSVVGLPDLRAGSVVYITGVGVRFSGRYFVTSTTHAISDSGYTTSFECRREELKEKANVQQ